MKSIDGFYKMVRSSFIEVPDMTSKFWRAVLDIQTGQSHQGLKSGVILPRFGKQAMWETINSFVNHFICNYFSCSIGSRFGSSLRTA